MSAYEIMGPLKGSDRRIAGWRWLVFPIGAQVSVFGCDTEAEAKAWIKEAGA